MNRHATTVLVVAMKAGMAIHWAMAAEVVVEAKDGNIILHSGKNEAKQLTSSGRDSAPVLAPDGKWVVFVRKLLGKTISTGIGDVDAEELWQVKASGEEATLLVAPREDGDMQVVIADFHNMCFSSDGRFLFFVTKAWTTSGAVHMVDRTSRKTRFIVPGNDLSVIRSGEYRDCLLVRQHRYFLAGGTYDWFWLFKKDGEEIGPVGENTSDFMDLYCPDKTAHGE